MEMIKNELLKSEVLKNGVERKYIKLYFGSRCEEDFDDVALDNNFNLDEEDLVNPPSDSP